MPGRAVPILILLALAAFAPLAHAQVYRCIGAHGEPVFSGEPCGTPAPTAGESAGSGTLAATCADSPQALRRAIAGAFAARDVNRLAGLILWQGFSQSSARAVLRSLVAWLHEPLLGITIVYPTGPPLRSPNTVTAHGPAPAAAATGGNAPAPIGYEVSTTGDTRDFGVTEFGGCWLLTLSN